MALRPITVTQLNDYIARVFDSDTLLMNVAVTGEISNLKYHSSGHVYFSLNDENSKVNCFLPSSYVRTLKYELDIMVFPVQVQGDGAAADIAGMLKFVNDNYDDIDTLIVGRGGGSQEDLWAFNEEILARAIYDSRIPVISAVGHEIDFSISDFVADLRAETPTAAADIAVPDIKELVDRLDKFSSEMLLNLKNVLRVGELKVEQAYSRMKQDMDLLLLNRYNEIEKFKLILEQNDPHRIMERGYTVIESDGRVIRTPEELKDGEYDIVFRSGKVRVRIENV